MGTLCVSLSQCCRRQSEIRRSCWWKTQSWRRTLSSWELSCKKNREDARVDERRRKTGRLNAQNVFVGDTLSQNILGFCRMFLLCSFHFPEDFTPISSRLSPLDVALLPCSTCVQWETLLKHVVTLFARSHVAQEENRKHNQLTLSLTEENRADVRTARMSPLKQNHL